jgi:hypothetical protein
VGSLPCWLNDGKLLQLGVFGFSGDEDGNVGVGIFPQREEILMGGSGRLQE